MNIIDYLLLGAFAAAALYIGYRLFVGWLRTPPYEIESEISTTPNHAIVAPSARERGLASAAAAEMTDMPSQMR